MTLASTSRSVEAGSAPRWPTAEWWYVRLYTAGPDAFDAVLDEVLAPLAEQARAAGATRWHFIRYTDLVGPHLRLRVLGARHVLDGLHAELPDLTVRLEAVASRTHPATEKLFPLPPSLQLGEGGRGARPALYEPEYAKYGGLAGVRAAEKLFEPSSDLAVWAVRALPAGPTRAALAVHLLGDAARTCSAGDDQQGWELYWSRHLAWWTARPTGGDALRTKLRETADADRAGVRARLTELADDPQVVAWRTRWQTAVAAALVETRAGGVTLTDKHLVFHYAHMMTNRLGFLPREEAMLGLIAASAGHEPVAV